MPTTPQSAEVGVTCEHLGLPGENRKLINKSKLMMMGGLGFSLKSKRCCERSVFLKEEEERLCYED